MGCFFFLQGVVHRHLQQAVYSGSGKASCVFLPLSNVKLNYFFCYTCASLYTFLLWINDLGYYGERVFASSSSNYLYFKWTTTKLGAYRKHLFLTLKLVVRFHNKHLSLVCTWFLWLFDFHIPKQAVRGLLRTNWILVVEIIPLTRYQVKNKIEKRTIFDGSES